MFPSAYFPATYFSPAYFPAGVEVVVVEDFNACVHGTDAARWTVAITDRSVNTLTASDFALSAVAIDDEVC